MFECPIDYFTDNLIFGHDRTCWAAYELKGFDYDLISDESKIVLLNKLTLFISNINAEAKFMIIPVTQDTKEHFRGYVKGLSPNDELYSQAKFLAEQTCTYLCENNEINRTNDYKTIVLIKLQKDGEMELATQAKEALQFFVRGIINDFNAFMSVDSKDVLLSKVKGYTKLATQVYEEQSKRLALIPLNTDTTQWLLRRMMFRGLPKEVKLFKKSQEAAWKPKAREIELAGAKYLRPQSRELVNLFSGVIRKRGRCLQIEHDGDISYQTFLVITNIPEDLNFPDCEWIYLLQTLKLHGEMCIHIKTIEHRKAIKKIDYQRRAANSQLENITKADSEVPEDLFESKEAIDSLEAELKSAKFPIVKASVTICMADNDLERLESRAQNIRQEYEDINFIVERPLTDQFSLFMQCIPTVSFTVNDFVLKLTPLSLASGMIGATRELGSAVGSYIGTTSAGKQVYLDLRQACLSNISASATFYGNLGYGKSFNANLLAFLHILNGAYGLIIDPKGERTHWVTDLTSMQGLISLVTLSPDPEYKGMLDPFNIFRGNISDSAELAINLISELFRIKSKDDEYVALLEAINRIKGEALPSMKKLSEILNNFSADDELERSAKMLARKIALLKDSGMAQLLIGDGTEKAINLNNRLNILQIQNLKLPSPDTKKEDYTQEEVISTVLMMVIAAFSKRFIHNHPNRFKVLLFDESWLLGRTVEGEKLMSYVGRMSRSLYTSMILNGHSVTDLPNEGIRNSITYKFCFHTDSTEEAERMLDYLKLEKTKKNISLLTSLGNAQCLFQDLNGRVGVLNFDAVFDDLIDVFSTTPIDETQKQVATVPHQMEQSTELDEPDEYVNSIDIFALES